MIRDVRQREFADVFIDSKSSGILYLCPRFGKCRVAIHIFESLGEKPRVLIAYPDKEIQKSWEEEFSILGYKNPNIEFVTHRSLAKRNSETFDLVVLDEIHLLSDAQIRAAKKLQNNRILGLTGTLKKWTRTELSNRLRLNVLAEYSIDQAIKEDILTDYRIIVETVDLDDKKAQKFGKKIKTEKKQYDAYTWVINKLEKEKKDSMFVKLGRMRVVQSSLAKLNKTKELLKRFKEERVLVFCGLTKIADNLGISSYHNKIKEKQIFQDFANGNGIDQLAVVKIGNTGITYKPLNKVIINYFDSNAENLAQRISRCMAKEYQYPSKIATIYIISSTEEAEINWLRRALEFFDPDKITYK